MGEGIGNKVNLSFHSLTHKMSKIPNLRLYYSSTVMGKLISSVLKGTFQNAEAEHERLSFSKAGKILVSK